MTLFVYIIIIFSFITLAILIIGVISMIFFRNEKKVNLLMWLRIVSQLTCLLILAGTVIIRWLLY